MRALAMFWKLTRYARAARFWLLLALAVLGWVGFGQARAQSNTECTFGAGCNIEQAAQACKAFVDSNRASFPVVTDNCTHLGYAARYTSQQCVSAENCSSSFNRTGAFHYSTGCPGGLVWNESSRACTCPSGSYWQELIPGQGSCQTCLSIGSKVTLFSPTPGSVGCTAGGCAISYYDNGDGETMTTQPTGANCKGNSQDCSALSGGNYYWNPVFNVCAPVSPQCPEGQKEQHGVCVKNDFCPTGQVMNEKDQCVPHEGECPAGTRRDLMGMCTADSDDNKCPAGQIKGADGTCKPDANEDGEEDESEKSQFSGGDSCQTPPMCSGDAILCGQARTQWRIDCNTRRNQKISGGGCGSGSMPVCVGESCDLMEYAQLVTQWRATCALEKMSDKGGAIGEGEEGIQGDPDFDADADGKAAIDRLGDDGVDPSDAFSDGSANNGGQGGNPGGDGELDTAGLGLPRSCPNLPSVNVLGTTLDFNQAGGVMCNWISIGGYFVLVLAAFASLRILSSGGSA